MGWQPSHKAFFIHQFISQKSVKLKSCQVNSFVLPINDQLHNGPPDSNRMLQAMATKTVGKEKVSVVWVVANNKILINVIVVVEACPCTFQLLNRQLRPFYET